MIPYNIEDSNNKNLKKYLKKVNSKKSLRTKVENPEKTVFPRSELLKF